MKKIEESFNGQFSHWEIHLPAEAVQNRQRGKINKRGWTIWYLFGSDEKGEYLDYYAHNRFTNDTHMRIYEDGSQRGLGAIWDMGPVHSPEDSEEVIREKKAEFVAKNREIAQMLEDKGFGITGDEIGSARLIRWMVCDKWLPGKPDDKD